MKLLVTLFLAAILLPHNPAIAQTAAKPETHSANHSASTRPAAHSCLKVPELSPKIPAIATGASCIKPLYTITVVPNIMLSDVSPLAAPTLRDDLGITAATSFSLGYVDIKTGTGALAVPHKWYTIQYTGYLPDGLKFDSSYDPGHDPLTFLQGPGPQGRRMVVVGMDTGIDGMRIGGKRRLFIPSELGYRAAGNPQGKIPPNSWLIFDVELVSQSDTPPAPKTVPTPPSPAAPGASVSPAGPKGSGPTGQPQNSTPAAAPAPATTPAAAHPASPASQPVTQPAPGAKP